MLKQNLNRNRAKTCKNLTYASSVNTFNDFLFPPPLAYGQILDPPLIRSTKNKNDVDMSLFYSL